MRTLGDLDSTQRELCEAANPSARFSAREGSAPRYGRGGVGGLGRRGAGASTLSRHHYTIRPGKSFRAGDERASRRYTPRICLVADRIDTGIARQ